MGAGPRPPQSSQMDDGCVRRKAHSTEEGVLGGPEECEGPARGAWEPRHVVGGFGWLRREHRRRPQLRVCWAPEAGANSRPGPGSGMEQQGRQPSLLRVSNFRCTRSECWPPCPGPLWGCLCHSLAWALPGLGCVWLSAEGQVPVGAHTVSMRSSNKSPCTVPSGDRGRLHFLAFPAAVEASLFLGSWPSATLTSATISPREPPCLPRVRTLVITRGPRTIQPHLPMARSLK